MDSPSTMVTKLALKNKMKYRNITFIPVDNRNYYDFFMRDMLWQTDQFAYAINNNYAFPSCFYNIASENYLAHLEDRYQTTRESIENSVVNQEMKKQHFTEQRQKYQDSYNILNELLKTHNIERKQHIFHLIKKLNISEKNRLFLALNAEHNFAMDTNLLNNVLEQSEKHSLSVLLTGALHTNTIEKCLSQLPEFKKDLVSSMTLPDLKMNDLNNIQWPQHVPSHFMNPNMQKFIQHINE